jgi:uncharacterized protein YpmB
METARFVAIFTAIFVSVFVSFFCLILAAFDQSETRRSAARDRRLAEHRMNARLLRLDI